MLVIRGTAFVCGIVVLIAILYFPSAHPPERFLELLRYEHAHNQAELGQRTAVKILSRAMDIAEGNRNAPVPVAAAATTAGTPVDAAVVQLGSTLGGLFNNRYMRSIDALFILASYRLSTLIEYLGPVLIFGLAGFVDSLVRRYIKAKEFIHHSPELFAVFAAMAIMLVCGVAVVLVTPLPLHWLVLPALPVAVVICVSLAVANFHSRAQ